MAGDKWDGKISNLNISEQAFPELHAELSKCTIKRVAIGYASLPSWPLFSSNFWQNDCTRAIWVGCTTCSSTSGA